MHASLRFDSAAAPSRRLRILQVVPTYFPAVRYGGPIRSVHALAKGLVARGHEVHVFTSSMDGPGDLEVEEATPLNVDGVLVHYFRVPFLRRLCWCPTMLAALKEHAPHFDVMHLHSVFLWPTYAAARIAASVGLPYVVAPRGMLGEVVIRRKSRWVKNAWIQLIEQKTLRAAAGVHVTTDLESEEIRALGLQLPEVFCVPNSVTWPAEHSPLAEGPFAQIPRPYVLFLSRIDWKKGLDRLIEAWKWVPDLLLVIAGNDEDGYQRKLESIAAEHGVVDRVRFVGPVTDAQKWALYENALMFALPSYSENFGNVVAEAMAMGCPVVVTPEVGLAHIVEQSGSGIVAPGEPRRFAQAINALRRDPARRQAMGDQGRLTARRHLSSESVADRFESIYREIMDRGGSGGARWHESAQSSRSCRISFGSRLERHELAVGYQFTGIRRSDSHHPAIERGPQLLVHERIVGLEESLELGVPLDVDFERIRANLGDAIRHASNQIEHVLQVGARIDPTVIVFELQDPDPAPSEQLNGAADDPQIVTFRVDLQQIDIPHGIGPAIFLDGAHCDRQHPLVIDRGIRMKGARSGDGMGHINRHRTRRVGQRHGVDPQLAAGNLR